MWRACSVLAITAVAVIEIQISRAAEISNKPAETEEVTVTAEATESLTSASPDEAATQNTQVPGGFTIKTADKMKRGRASNFEDLLQRAPGVFLQSENGAEGLFDQFGSIGVRSRDGFREHSAQNTEILFADLGYKFSEQAENRFYVTLDRTHHNLPGGLTKSELEDAPSQGKSASDCGGPEQGMELHSACRQAEHSN